jgi:hypothetical protein
MQRSEQISDLIAALAKAQGAFGVTAKDRENPHFKSSYATLASGWTACRAALSANSIAVVQSLQTEENGVEVETMLAHASGQWITSTLFVPTAKFDAQGLGSASTYGRRYALFSMLGLAPEDDDGNDAAESMQGKNDKPVQRQERRAPAPRVTGDETIPYGPHKGKSDTDPSIPLGYLSGDLEPAIAKSVDNPEKAKFKRANETLLAAVRETLLKRAADAHQHGAPSGDANGAWGLEGDRIADTSPEA